MNDTTTATDVRRAAFIETQFAENALRGRVSDATFHTRWAMVQFAETDTAKALGMEKREAEKILAAAEEVEAAAAEYVAKIRAAIESLGV